MFKYSLLLNALAVLEEGAGFRHEPACWKQNQLGRVSPGISIAVGAPGAHHVHHLRSRGQGTTPEVLTHLTACKRGFFRL